MQGDLLRRRDFITLLGGATAWPLAARAQQPERMRTVGFVGADASAWSPWTGAFVARLHELGWIEGRNIVVEYRWTAGRPERIAEIAAEFVRRNVDVIVTNDSSAPAMKQATLSIPIVLSLGNDPIGSGLVANLARPGGNVTGLSTQQTETDSKRLELLHQILPQLRRVAVIANVGNHNAVRQIRDLTTAAEALGLHVLPLEIRRAEDVAPAFAALNSQATALYIVQDALVIANIPRIMTFALTARLPTVLNSGDQARFGGLMSYGPSFPAIFRRTADLVDKILRGTKPGDIPVEQPTKFELVINLSTAKALGITIPSNVLALADEVIE
jgi:putative ABC transport system substrate-binding protein